MALLENIFFLNNLLGKIINFHLFVKQYFFLHNRFHINTNFYSFSAKYINHKAPSTRKRLPLYNRKYLQFAHEEAHQANWKLISVDPHSKGNYKDAALDSKRFAILL